MKATLLVAAQGTGPSELFVCNMNIHNYTKKKLNNEQDDQMKAYRCIFDVRQLVVTLKDFTEDGVVWFFSNAAATSGVEGGQVPAKTLDHARLRCRLVWNAVATKRTTHHYFFCS